MKREEVAEKIALKIGRTHRWPELNIPDIAAILAEEYGDVEAMREAINETIDDNRVSLGEFMPDDKALWGTLRYKLAKSVNRAIDNGDGTVTITERKES